MESKLLEEPENPVVACCPAVKTVLCSTSIIRFRIRKRQERLAAGSTVS
jgi:hypothetical protein